jgi:DNA-binding transcriptional regulator YbjK
MTSARLDSGDRRNMIVTAAVRDARRRGVLMIDIVRVARLCPVTCSAATVRRYFHTLRDLQAAVRTVDPDIPDVI